jgi:uncharacterized protein (DUF2141 family)
MKLSALIVIGLGFAATAAAQTRPMQVEMVPMPESLPQLLFAPNPIAGTMLKPLGEPTGAPADIAPEGNPDAVAQAQPVTGEPTTTEGIAAAPPEGLPAETPAPAVESPPAAEPSVAAIPETPVEVPAAAPVPGAAPAAPEAAPTPSGSVVHIIVENVTEAAGIVNVAVCDKGLSEEGCPYKTSVPAAAGFVEAKLDGVPPGNYAVVGYHDVNGNDEFDKFLGLPREPYALSSTAAESLVPSFSDAALPIHEGENTVIIRLKTFGGG